MVKKIEGKITGVEVRDSAAPAEAEVDRTDNVVHMHEKLERPPTLTGSTYKIRTPMSEHSLYVTINDIVFFCTAVF